MTWFKKGTKRKTTAGLKRPWCKYGCVYLNKAGNQMPILMKTLYVSQKNAQGKCRFTRIGVICSKCNHIEFDRKKSGSNGG